MASKNNNKKPAESPAFHRKSQQQNTVNPDAAKKDEPMVGGIGAYIRELLHINQKLSNKLDQFSRLYTESPLHATEIATLVLDRELRIRDYTPSMQALFSIVPDDLGQPIRHLQNTLRYTRFMEDAEEVLRTLVPVEREVQGAAGEWFLIRMRPYRTVADETHSLIFTLEDITQLKAAQAELAELNETSALQLKEFTQALEKMQDKAAQARDLFYELFDIL
jgi:two-component system, chemotaxis family, CheB/CheR fusion protein